MKRIALFCCVWAGTWASGLQAAPPPEARFQFDHNSIPSVHTLVLKWPAPEASLQSIDVLVSDSKEVIQTIQVPQDKVKLVWKDLKTSKPNELHDKVVELIDYNFDQYPDLRLLREWPHKVGSRSYLVYLFDEKQNQYLLHEAISALPSPVPNAKTQRIESTTLGAYGGFEYVSRHFSITPAGQLHLQARIRQKMTDPPRLTAERDIAVRVKGELQRVCRLRVPTEGVVKRIWGRRRDCEPFLRKE